MNAPLTRDRPKVSILSQIAEVKREIEMRERVYGERVRKRAMRESEAQLLIGRMEAVLATLEFCRDHEADIRAFMASRKGGQA
jgi:hypothetical protein